MTQPRTVGKYRLLGELGRGGMATVFLAAVEGPSRFTKLVVVKQLKTELAAEVEFREMFLDEARLAARLNHPNIVQTYEVMEGDGKFLIIMEYLEGQPLSNVRSRLVRKNALALAEHVRVLADVLEGLHAAHEARDWDGTPLNVVHRDVSPHNVFVTYDGQVKVVDFGVAKAATSSQHTQTGVIKGKISYMAPEQALGRGVDRRADLFAVGIMLWEAIAGRRMWKDLPDAGIIHYLASAEVPKLTDFAPDTPHALQVAVERALACDPGARFATAAEMRASLDDYLATLHPAPQLRAVGAAVAEHFTEERARIRVVIEQQLSQGPFLMTGELASMGLPQLPSPEPSVSMGAPAPVVPPNKVGAVGNPSGVSALAANEPLSTTGGTNLSMSSAMGAPSPAARTRNVALVISTAATALGFLSLALVMLWRATHDAVPGPPLPATTLAPPSASVAPLAVPSVASEPSAVAVASSSARPKDPHMGPHVRPKPSASPSSTAPPAKPTTPGDIILHR